MSVDRMRTDRFSSGADQARRSALANANFVCERIEALKKVDPTGKMQRAVKSFRSLLANGEDLTPPQYSFLESIYEKTISAAYGVESVNVHSDVKRRGLRFG